MRTAAARKDRPPLVYIGTRAARGTGDRGVGNDDPIDAAPTRHGDDVVQVGERDVRRDLQEHRRSGRGICPCIEHARQEIVERRRLLQVAQARRIGRGNVDGEIAGAPRKRCDARHVVGRPVRRILVGADVDADDPATACARHQSRLQRSVALVVEAQSVDYGGIAVQAKQARPRVARLRERGHRPRLGKAESRPQHGVDGLAVLVESCRGSDRVGEVEAEGPHRQPPVVGRLTTVGAAEAP
jgi:hypothetical protein